MKTKEQAQLEFIERIASDIAGSLAEAVTAMKAENEELDVPQVVGAITTHLLSVGWKMAAFAVSDHEDAKAFYAGLLRNFADGIDLVTH